MSQDDNQDTGFGKCHVGAKKKKEEERDEKGGKGKKERENMNPVLDFFPRKDKTVTNITVRARYSDLPSNKKTY